MSALKNGALYIRVSTADQTELSPDAQQRLLLDYAKKNGIVIAKEFIFEESVSGRHADRRPKFQEMIALAKQDSHPIDVILVWKYSRFARNQEESIVYKSLLKKNNIDVISISEPLIDGPFGTLIERIIEWMDEYYSIRLSGEVIRGMKEKALKHGYQTSPCLGYDAAGSGKPFVINEAEYSIVKFIMDQYDLENHDPTAIARSCNELGYHTKRGNLMERRSVERILRNPFYAGTVIWNGISFEGAHEARLDRERFNNRIKRMDARRRTPKSRNPSSCKHWLSGLLKCPVCGATLTITAGNTSCPYFQCWKYAKGLHKVSNSITVAKAERTVFRYFDEILAGADFFYTVRNKTLDVEKDDTVARLQQALDHLSMRESRIKLAFENGIDTLEEYGANKKRLLEERQHLQQELDRTLAPAALPVEMSKEDFRKEICNVNDVLKDPNESSETKGLLLRSIVDRIVYEKASGTMYFDFFVS